MTDIKGLKKEEELEVTGGGNKNYHINYMPGDRKRGPCKYCGAVDSLVFERLGSGYEDGDYIVCNVFRCEKCGKDNYFSIYDDHLIQ